MHAPKAPGHNVRWFVYVHDADGNRIKIPRQATMRGRWGFDVECSCGWMTRTGGGVRSYLEAEVFNHKVDVAYGEEN